MRAIGVNEAIIFAGICAAVAYPIDAKKVFSALFFAPVQFGNGVRHWPAKYASGR